MTVQALRRDIAASGERLVELCCALTRIDSQNPPGDTGPLVSFIETWLGARPDIEMRRIVARAPAVNLVVRLRGGGPGRRLVFNGHLDTFPIGDAAGWTVPPLGGIIEDGRIHGRGVSDMKAGIAAALLALDLLSRRRAHWRGELVLTLVADEETGGTWGTKYLLAHVPEASGDAMISGDAGSPRIVRFGEKGQMWIELRASGRAAHGAHVHLGINAIDRLTAAVSRVGQLEAIDCRLPPEIAAAIDGAAEVSEAVSGAGEAAVLRRLTVNTGIIAGGSAVNLVPDLASARLDLRFPPGISAAEIERRLRAALAGLDGVEVAVLSACEPNWTDPGHEIVRLALRHAGETLQQPVAANMRIGFSDARHYRAAGVPSIVYGPTPHNMGGPDEWVTVDDLKAVFQVHTLCAFEYLAL